MEEKPLFCGLSVYRERGAYLRRLEQYEKSKASYDMGYKIKPDDVPLLIGRSQVCAETVKPEQAYANAELALELDPVNMLARNMQAQAMYTMTDFEKSIVMNHRGNRIRKQPPYFQTGINQGAETIEDCIGVNAGHVMLNFLPLIKETENMKAVQEQNIPTPLHKCRIPRTAHTRKKTQVEVRNDLILERVLAMKYLGPMAYDKFFLQELLKDTRLNSANVLGSEELKSIVNEALASMTQRQNILRAQRPYYSIQMAEKSKSQYQNKYKAAMLIQERLILQQIAQKYLEKLRQTLSKLQINDMMSLAIRMQSFLNSKSPKNLPNKDKYIEKLYRIVGEGYLGQHRLSYELNEHQNRQRVAFLMGMSLARVRSYDSVMANFPKRYIDLKKVTKDTSEALEMCENSTQRCFLYYEMSRLQSAQQNLTLAKFYAKRCQREAQELDSPIWWLNGCFALLSGDMQQGNENDIRVAVETALEFAKKLYVNEQVITFLNKCVDMVSEPQMGDDVKPVLQRERNILSVMDEQTRVEQHVLFKRISTVPPGRRFKVLPQKAETQEKSERKRRKQVGLTVVPGNPVALAPPPHSDVRGFQPFDL